MKKSFNCVIDVGETRRDVINFIKIIGKNQISKNEKIIKYFGLTWTSLLANNVDLLLYLNGEDALGVIQIIHETLGSVR